MKRFLAVAAVGLAAVAVYATVAPAGQQAVTPKQFAALSKKVTTLNKKVTSLTKELVAVETCALDQAVSIAQYGDPPTQGYVYSNPDLSLEPQTALDVSPPDTAQAWMLITSRACADIINSNKKKNATSFRAHVK
jgi:hypothetical protein